MKTGTKILILIFCFTTIGSVAQSVDEIVAKHIEAIGGRENWLKVKSMRMETLMKMQGAEIRSTEVIINRKAMRSDISLMGMSGYTVITNTEGWSFSPWNGQTKAEAMTADDVRNSQDGLELLDKFITYQELGKKLEYFDSDDIDGIECFKLKMTDKEGIETTFFIDPENYQIIKEEFKLVSNGQEIEFSTFFSDFTLLKEGIVVPMITSSGGGNREVTKIEINPAIDDSIFKIVR
jgi:outer membrane lipoprotein-sorting protein